MNKLPYAPQTESWQRLEALAEAIQSQSIRELFEAHPGRFEEMSFERSGLLVDFSRQRIDRDVLDSLIDLCHEVDVPGAVEKMYSGSIVNETEGRPALHIALRRPVADTLRVDGIDVMPLVEAERKKMYELADALHGGSLKGFSGKPISDIVNIGIGGSDLGIVMACTALAEQRLPGLGLHYISNIDGVGLSHVLERVDPETTMFVICSKSFTTLETLTNARAVKKWLVDNASESAVASQCVAVSTNHQAMDAFGIAADKRLAMWDWVGGRYSLWSAVGLTIALAVGSANFRRLLAGANAMDEHFRASPPAENLAVLLGLVGIWNRNFLGATSHAVLPYDDHLNRLPAYLQQLEMESNGKSVRRSGDRAETATCPVIWGEPGSNAQHSFYQLLHQGTEPVSIDFILPANSLVGRQTQQDLAAANCLAQAWALAEGETDTSTNNPHQRYPGNRPSTLILFESLDPETLGNLVALYEHKVFVQSVIWDINPFDQYGVELGKRLASRLTNAADGDDGSDPLTIAGALKAWRAWRGA